MIGLSDPSLLKKHDTEVVLIKEQSKLSNKLYHVCGSYDILSVKLYKYERRNYFEESKEDLLDPLTGTSHVHR